MSVIQKRPCPVCNGSGLFERETCPRCAGAGETILPIPRRDPENATATDRLTVRLEELAATIETLRGVANNLRGGVSARVGLELSGTVAARGSEIKLLMREAVREASQMEVGSFA